MGEINLYAYTFPSRPKIIIPENEINEIDGLLTCTNKSRTGCHSENMHLEYLKHR